MTSRVGPDPDASSAKPVGPDNCLVLSLWTADRGLAVACRGSGIDRLGVDLEGQSKAGRQDADGSNWFSDHQVADLHHHAQVMPGRLFARTEAVDADWPAQAELAIAAGASWLILPNIESLGQLRLAAEYLGQRAALIPMLESRRGLQLLPQLIAAQVCSEVYFGANDLARELGLPTRTHAMIHPSVVTALTLCRESGLPFGIGGATTPRMTGLPVPPALILRFLASAGAQRMLLGRSFVASVKAGQLAGLPARVSAQVTQIRDEVAQWPAGARALAESADELHRFCSQIP